MKRLDLFILGLSIVNLVLMLNIVVLFHKADFLQAWSDVKRIRTDRIEERIYNLEYGKRK